jgi:hypothetical protein
MKLFLKFKKLPLLLLALLFLEQEAYTNNMEAFIELQPFFRKTSYKMQLGLYEDPDLTHEIKFDDQSFLGVKGALSFHYAPIELTMGGGWGNGLKKKKGANNIQRVREDGELKTYIGVPSDLTGGRVVEGFLQLKMDPYLFYNEKLYIAPMIGASYHHYALGNAKLSDYNTPNKEGTINQRFTTRLVAPYIGLEFGYAGRKISASILAKLKKELGRFEIDSSTKYFVRIPRHKHKWSTNALCVDLEFSLAYQLTRNVDLIASLRALQGKGKKGAGSWEYENLVDEDKDYSAYTKIERKELEFTFGINFSF